MKISHQNGFSLVELLIVIVIMGTLATIAGIYANSMLQRYAIEGQIREMYADLMNARARAMQRNRTHFASLTAGALTVYEDTNTAPDGNGILEPASDRLVLQKTLKKSMTPASSMTFDSKGMAASNQTLCIFNTVAPSFDCMIVSATRINTGKILVQNVDGGACDAANCLAK